MTRPRKADLAGAIQHAGNRGHDLKEVFKSAFDYADFMNRLLEGLRITNAELLAYCLMPNHTHLLIRLGMDGGLARLMRVVNIGYARRFNSEYGRRGALFESRYWQRHIVSDFYLAAAQLYIEANPVVATLEENPADWPWSSARHHMLEPCSGFLAASNWYESLGPTSDERRRAYREVMAEYLRTRRPPDMWGRSQGRPRD